MVVGEFTREVDLIVVGGGPGGYSAAFRAAELGVSTMVVDKRDALGGTCLHSGCIPSKTLLHIAQVVRTARQAERFGLHFDAPRIEVEEIRAWVDQSVAKLAKGLDAQARKLGVERETATAAFDDAKQMSLRGGEVPRVRFRRAIVAAGVSHRQHSAFPDGDDRIMSPGQALSLKSIPKRLLVVGHDAYAVELASIYAALGSAVTLVTEEVQLLPFADADLIRPLQRSLSNELGALHVKTKIGEVVCGDALRIHMETPKGEESADFDAAIVAMGAEPNFDELQLDRANVRLSEDGFIAVNEQMTTSNGRILAVGDVTGEPCLADRALAQGRVAGEVVAGWNSALDVRAIPHVVFTDPHVAWCGLTERTAHEQGVKFKVAKIPWGASGRAVGMDAAAGVTKLIYDPDTKVILGVGIVGVGAAEMIGEGALAIEMGVELDDIAGTVHPHPSMAELIVQAAQI